MHHRERALAAMRGLAVDTVPFIARMDLWHSYNRARGTLPAGFEGLSLWDMQRELGIGIFGFGAWDISFFRLERVGIQVETAGVDGVTTTRWRTPYGDLVARDAMSAELAEAAGTGARIEYPFKSAADYDALQYLLDHTGVVENFDAYGKFVDSIGTDGLALPFSGHLPAHQLMLSWMGYQRFYYELADNPRRIDGLVESLERSFRSILRLAASCPADAVEVGGNYDEHMTPPPVFGRFFAPLYREARQTLSAAGRILVVHGDGEMIQLLAQLRECGVEVVEALTPRPMTSISVAGARRIFGDSVCLWGGIPSVVLTEAFTEEQFEASLEELFREVAPGRRFVLGFGDNAPTDALWSRIRRVAGFWRENGAFPLRTGPAKDPRKCAFGAERKG